MNLTLRQAIVQRVQDKDTNELSEVIQESIDGDERALPGLGVLFEIIWKNTPDELHSDLVHTLKAHL